MYYLLMSALYVAIWFLTMCTFWFAVFGGLLTAGIGSFCSLYLYQRFICAVRFDRFKSALPGAVAFGFVDITQLSLKDPLIPSFFGFTDSTETMFADIFVMWQVLVGVYLIRLVIRFNLEYGAVEGLEKPR
ncbi:MAG: hypothetical protein EOO88_37035, partial [Pedobacter sp.]